VPLNSVLVVSGLIAAVVLFIFISGRGRRHREAQEIVQRRAEVAETLATIRNMIADFGDFIQKSPLSLTDVGDVSLLPHPKEKLLEAFLLMLRLTNDEALRENLMAGAAGLARYQRGVGPKILKGINLPDAMPTGDLSQADLTRFAESLLDGVNRNRWQKFNARAQEEALEIMKATRAAVAASR
jgi:hypothetical protein